MGGPVHVQLCPGCRRQFSFQIQDQTRLGQKLAFCCPKCGQPSAVLYREDAQIPSESAGVFRFASVGTDTGVETLTRLLVRESRLGMLELLAGSGEAARQKAGKSRSANRRYFLRNLARELGAPFWGQLIALPDRQQRLDFFCQQFADARDLLEAPIPVAEDPEALTRNTVDQVLAGDSLLDTPWSVCANEFAGALTLHAVSRELFWAAYLEESLSIPDVGLIFAQATKSQQLMRDMESSLGEILDGFQRLVEAIIVEDTAQATALEEALKQPDAPLPPEALVYEE